MPGGRYSPRQVVDAFRAEHPGQFDHDDISDLLAAIKVEDPETYGLIDPLLLGSENLPSEAAPPSKPTFLGGPQKGKPLPHPEMPAPIPLVPLAPRSWMDTAVTTAGRVLPAMVGGITGALTAPVTGPVGPLAGQAVGGAAGDYAMQAYERRLGLRPDEGTNWTEVGVQGALNAVPLGELSGLGPLAGTAVRAGQGALLGRAGNLAESTIEGRPPDAPLPAYGGGAVAGGAFHAAGEVLPTLRRAAPNLDYSGLPTDAPPQSPLMQVSHMIEANRLTAAANEMHASEVATEFAKRGWTLTPEQRGSISRGMEAKSMLEEIAQLTEPPPLMPPIMDVPLAPPAPLQLPAGRGDPNAIISMPADMDPNLIDQVGGQPPRFVQTPRTIDRLETNLEQTLGYPPGPGRLVPQKQLALTPDAPVAGAAAPESPLLAMPQTPTDQPIRPTMVGGRKGTTQQPRIPGTDAVGPIDREYTAGPNAGPRRTGEAHGTPREGIRYVDTPTGRKQERYPSPVIAEDPATYPPEVRREIARMVQELVDYPHEKFQGGITRAMIDDLVASNQAHDASDAIAQLRKGGASAGGAQGGASVFHDIIHDAQGLRAGASREDIIQALRQALLEGKGSALSDSAAQVARKRMAEEALPREERGRHGWRLPWGKNHKAYRTLHQTGAGDELIGWVDEASGAKALPSADHSPARQMAGEMTDQELWGLHKLVREHGPDLAEDGQIPEIHREMLEEGIRRGLWNHEQSGLVMEAPGGAKGPSLFDFEGGSEKAAAPRSPEEPPADPLAPSQPPQDTPLPGLESVQDESRPMPQLTDAPFALTPEAAVQNLQNRRQQSLWDRLKGEEGVLIFNTPAGDRAGLKKWLAKQEKDYGDESWFSRAEEAVAAGDWDRAWKIAASASVKSFATAYNNADPQDASRLEGAVRGTPLQMGVETDLIAAARRKDLRREPHAPTVSDYPPSPLVSQAGAARGKAKIGPAGVINPGSVQRPLQASATDLVLSRGLQRSILEETDPELLHLIPGNEDTNLRLYRQVADLAFRGQNTREIKQYLHLSNEEIAQHYLRSVQEAARTLQSLSAFRQANAEVVDQAAEAMSMGGALRGVITGEAAPVYQGARGRVIGRPGQVEASRTLDVLATPTETWDQNMLLNTLQRPRKHSELELLQAASYPFMISKWATAVRNAATQAGRFGVDTLDEALTIPIAHLLGEGDVAAMAKGQLGARLESGVKPSAVARRPWKDTVQDVYDISADALEHMSPEDARQTLKLLSAFPSHEANFLGWALGEDAIQGRSRHTILNAALNPKFQRWLTVFNRAQEFTGRGMIFDAHVRGALRAQGIVNEGVLLNQPLDAPGGLQEAVGGPRQLDTLIHNATAAALEGTFASRTARGSIPAALVQLVNQAWPLKLGYPFPRFNLVAAPRYIWDHGPWALADLVRFPLDAMDILPGKGGRLYRGVNARHLELDAVPELQGKRAQANLRLGGAIRDLVTSRRELAVRNRQLRRLEGKGGDLPDTGTDDLVVLRDQLARRVERNQTTIGTERRTVQDLQAQEDALWNTIRDAKAIGAPTWSQFMARVGTGTAMLAAAATIRSQHGQDGTKWYQYRIDKGEGKDPITLDFRPFAPFAQYLFVADVMQDFYHHTDWTAAHQQANDEGIGGLGVGGPLAWSRAMWANYTGKYTGDELGSQFLQAFLSMSRAAGTTLTLTDLATTHGMPSPQDMADAAIGTVGQFLSRFTIPLGMAKDAIGLVDSEEAKARIPPRATLDEMSRPLTAPLANIPGVSRLIPDTLSQTTGRPIGESPGAGWGLARLLGGVSASTKDFVTEEVQRVGLSGHSVFIRETGDKGLDDLTAQEYSRVLQRRLPPILESDYYRSLPNPASQRDYLQLVFPDFKAEALGYVKVALGMPRYEGATRTGETARKDARQLAQAKRLRLLEGLEQEAGGNGQGWEGQQGPEEPDGPGAPGAPMPPDPLRGQDTPPPAPF